MLRRSIAATLLKIVCKNFYLVKSYNKTNMKVFAVILLENFSCGLTYFDQFSNLMFIIFRFSSEIKKNELIKYYNSNNGHLNELLVTRI